MKIAAVYIMLLVYALTFSEAQQFLKLPVLIHHFQEHHAEDPGLSLLGFLKLHYSGKFSWAEDYSRDQQLPFRSTNCLLNTISFCDIFLPPQLAVLPVSYPQPHYTVHAETVQGLTNGCDIFQPPRSC